LPCGDNYYERTRALLERAYLGARDPRGGSGFGGDPIGKILRDWGYAVAGEAEGLDTNGVILTRIAWTNIPET